MTISERLFAIMKEKNVSMPDLSRMTGISRHTIFDWQRRGTNPGADKIMVICEALQITPEELLMSTTAESSSDKTAVIDTGSFENQIIEVCRDFSDEQKRRLLAYVSMLQNMKK
ncbi:MAG: helix-turn-helix transcriptional regulator [Lachnospiraceae bacterium]|nr:helix-turn-helix transcriptional regulator [Lachnospiraceae bacterium]